MNKIINFGLTAIIVLLSTVPTPQVLAATYDPFGAACSGVSVKNPKDQPLACQTDGSNPISGTNGIFAKAERIIAFVAGAAAVLFILISGFRFINANGDAQKVASARTAIIYALIGLVIVVIAHGIVVLILNGIK